MKLVITIVFSIIVVVTFSSVSNAQPILSSVKREILAYLKKQDLCQGDFVKFTVENVKVGPSKSGYLSSCRHGGGFSVLYEETTSGIKKMLEVEIGMNGGFSPTKKANKGYYDISHYESGGGEVSEKIYRWNGSRYVLRR